MAVPPSHGPVRLARRPDRSAFGLRLTPHPLGFGILAAIAAAALMTSGTRHLSPYARHTADV